MAKKTYYLDVLLKGPETSKLIFDAWDAPVGSTKRIHARTVAKTMKRHYDGQGGPALVTTPSISGLSNYLSANQAYGTQSVPGVLLPTIKQQPYKPYTGAVTGTIAPQPGFAWNVSGPVATGTLPSTAGVSTTPTPSYTLPSALSGWNATPNVTGLPTQAPTFSGISTQGTIPQLSQSGLAWPTGFTQLNVPPPAAPAPKTTTTKPSTKERKKGTGKITTANFMNLTPTPAVPQTPAITWSGLAGMLTQDPNKPLAASVLDVMRNEQMKRQLFPGMSEYLYTNATLSEAVQDLIDKTKKDTELDQLTRTKINLVNQGNYFVKDLNDYVKTRDEYVKDIDNKLQALKDKMTSGAYSTDPNTQFILNQYQNSLIGLQSKQNKRYMDLMQSAADKYSADVASLDNEITAKTSEFQQILDTQTPILQEQYNNMMNTIISYAQQLETMSGTGAWLSGNSITGALSNIKGAISGTAEEIAPWSKVIDELDHYFKLPDAAGKLVFEPSSIETGIKDAMVRGATSKDLVKYLQYQAAAIAKTGDLNAVTKIKKALTDLGAKTQDASGTSLPSGDSLLNIPGASEAIFDAFNQQASSSIRSYIEGKIEPFRNALTSLFKINVNDPTQVEQWKQANAGIDNEDMLNSLISSYKTALNADPSIATQPERFLSQSGQKLSSWFGRNEMSDADLINNLVNKISATWKADWLKK